MLATIVTLVSLAVKAAPVVETVYGDAAALVSELFSKGLISKAEQASYMAWSDTHMNAVLAGNEPPEFIVS